MLRNGLILLEKCKRTINTSILNYETTKSSIYFIIVFHASA